MRPKTHSFSGFGNVPSSHTWQQYKGGHRPPGAPPRPPTPPPRVNEISMYSRQQAAKHLERQRRHNKPYQITQISSTIRNLTHKGPAKSVDAYIFTQVPSSLASSDEPDKLSELQQTQPPRDTIIEIGNGYAGYHTKKKRIVATPASSSLSFFREILFRIAEFICSLRGNY